MKALFLVLLSIIFFAGCHQGDHVENQDKGSLQTKEERMSWWKEARFGMFIHWGLYAIPAGEWEGEKISGISEWIMLRAEIPVREYEKLADKFNPVKFNAEEWVRMASEAGMKYIVITSKHHDGFAMYHSRVNPYNIVDATPFDRDPLAELAEACRKYNIKLGFYHSQAQDWHHPGGAYWGMRNNQPYWDTTVTRVPFMDYINEKAYPQVKEILSDYGDIAIMWWDTPVGMTREAAEKLHSLLDLQPGIIENNRLYGPWDGDFSTPEQHIPPTGLDYDWEVCMTMNTSWGYKYYDDNWKSSETLIQYLCDIASKGGNFLLNVGPTAEGVFPDESVQRLKEIGKWMDKNSESIYGTTASPFFKLFWGRCTKKKTENGYNLYLHVFDIPENKKITVPGLKNDVLSASMLANNREVSFEDTGEDIIISMPDLETDPYNTVIKLEISGEPDVISNIPKEDINGIIRLPAAYSFIHNRGYGDQAELSDLTENAHISNWVDPGTRLEYMFSVENPGEFEVFIYGATPGDQVNLDFQMEDLSTRFAFKGTGDISVFEERKLGTITLNKKGLLVLTINPVQKDWNPFALQNLLLKKK
jgi:alpha-L-fucosidase